MRIRNKTQFFEMWEAGLLGNRTQLWRDPDEAFASRVPNIGFREIGRTGGGKWERTERDGFWRVVDQWRAEGRRFIMDDGCPDDKRVLQGEICRTHKGMEGFLDTQSRLAMRPAMAAGHMRHCTYATCVTLLNRFMDAASRDDVDALLDLYPDATIEFSTFTTNVGVFRGRNTLFWECRDY